MKRFRLPQGWWVVVRGYVLPAILGLLLTVFVIWFMNQQTESIDRLRANYDEVFEKYEQLYSEAIVEGIEPSAPAPDDIDVIDDGVPEIILPEPGATGPPGPGPTSAQGFAAMATYCSKNDCRPVPSVAQVAAAISKLCATGICKGEDGKDADPVTADQIVAAVAIYCADGTCRGVDGLNATDAQVKEQVELYLTEHPPADGTNGTNGTDGTDGKDGTAKPGDYTCADGEVMVGFSVAEDGTVTLSCQTNTVPSPQPSMEPTP